MTMAEMMSDNWLVVVIVLVLVVLAAWWLLAASRRTRIERTETPASDQPAQRNRSLIDAPPASARVDLPPPTPEVLGGVSEVVAATAPPLHHEPPADDLKRIKGVGPKLETLLISLGVTRYSQIAAWDDAEIDRIDAQLGTFQGRVRRDDWPAQARFLAAGDTAGFEQRFGRV
jgi:predicted flap endonuclease-1-like 5' DNA nuclease